jgi:carboxypeptidase family protein/TonB-dependent receptor-like protein
MKCSKWLAYVCAFVAWTSLASAVISAQGGATSTISGSVTDGSGGIIPGADIVAKNNATSAESRAISSAQGTFAIPALNAGTYTVTVTLSGFKTAILNDVVLNAGVPASVKAVLEVGGLSETVVVQAATEVVQTQSATVASTLNASQITKLPVTSRNALDFIVNLPGVSTPGGTRDSTINGLPQGSINITLDGMNIQDNYLKTSDGFFARLSPRLDAIEEVTVTTAANGADSAGQGAVNIRFVTRSGSNRLTGSPYFYLRHDALNANTWFNNRNLTPDPSTGKAPKTELRQYQPGMRLGGPIVVPGLYDGHDKAFFFVNYEETRNPSQGTLTRTIMSPASQQGLFRYSSGSTVQQVDVLALAARSGLTSTIDPTIGKLLGDIRASTATTGTITELSDPSLQQFVFQSPVKNYTPAPTGRIDYNLSRSHRLTGSGNYQHINSNPDTTNTQQIRFPGFPIYGSQQSTRYTTSESLRSTFGTSLVNEVRVGATGGATFFSPEKNAAMWGGTSVADQAGFNLNINNFNGVANAGVTPTPNSREATTKNIEDTLSWVRGSHSMSFGGAFTQADLWVKSQTLVPTINFGLASGDPAESLFTVANFPGASNAQLTNARNLYAVLTGRALSITGNARLNDATGRYEYLGLGVQRGRMRQLGFFAQDQWRVRPDLTVNVGLRYELQLPFYSLNDSYSTATVADAWGISGVGNLFMPGVMTGQKPTFQALTKGTRAYNTDLNNFAPSLNLSWAPRGGDNFLGRVVGDSGTTVFRAGYALAYERPGMSDFSDVFGANPGVTITADRSTALGTLNQDGLGLPVLLRDRSRLGPPSFAATPQYPLTEVITGDLNVFNPDLQVPYAQTWTASIGRKLTRDVGIDVRYVGSRHLQGWIAYNYNEINIVENGFLDEFRKAQGNLQANIAAGRGNTFAYTGAPGTSPLPIFLAHYNGATAAQAGNTAAYTGGNWTNATFVGYLAANNPAPYSFASTNGTNGLLGNATFRGNALAAGLPANFFVANPDLLGGVNVTGNGGYTRYDSLQVEGRKRLSHGFQIDGSYVFGKAYSSERYSLRLPRYSTRQTGSLGGVTHAFKANWIWELPFGRDRRWMNTNNGVLARIVGGWELDGVVRVQSGTMTDYGNVRLVGMTADELQDAVGLYTYAVTGLAPDAATALYLLPQDIVENTVRAFNVSATTANGYGSQGAPTGRYLAPANGPDCIEVAVGAGQCGTRSLVLTGPRYERVDLSAVKRIDLVGRSNFEFRAEMLNAFNHPNFNPVISTSTNADNYRITGTQENSARIVQLVFRVNF